MASKKKVKKKATRRSPRTDDAAFYAEFIADLLSGLLGAATAMYVSRDEQGQLLIEYEEELDA